MKSYDVPVIFRVKAINKDEADSLAASICSDGCEAALTYQREIKARVVWWNFATIRSIKGGPT